MLLSGLMIVAMAGLPGSGKSTVARELSLRLPAVVISKDEIRTRLFSAADIDYSADQDAVCFNEMLKLAEGLLNKTPGQWIILDGRTFSRSRDMQQVIALADRLRQPLYVIRCFCSDEEARRRLDADLTGKKHPAANRDYHLYLQIKSRQEALPLPALDLDTSLDLKTCLSRCLEYLTARPPRLTNPA